ncbi:class I adenylate-forming enzyme family protein, partial [Steroidobacter sp.]|uniref:class I adenylate-forming enzyme family protein n=1 Tax=Steroidobacter sp. TaxID=1978227 RepID=UPI001A386A27
MAFTIHGALKWWARECPNQIALSVEDQPLTFLELWSWAGRTADYLAKLGVKPGDRVAAVAMNSLEYAVLAFGLMRAGALATPLSFRSTAHEIADAFSDTTPVLAFADRDRQAVLAEALGAEGASKLKLLDDIGRLRDGPEVDFAFEPDADTPVFIIGTSGSTARPKGVIYSHRSILTYASEFVIMEPRCGRGSRVLSVGPFSSSSGYLLLMQFISVGATLYIERHFEAARALRLLVEHQITTFQSAPIFFERIAALPGFADADLSHLYWTQVGGARVSQSLLKAWRDKGVVLRQLYGSTEAGGGWGARDDAAVSAPEKCGRGGIFTEYAILSENGGFAPPGTPGEILVRSPCLMVGYWNNPQATQEAVRDGWLHTGDLGILDDAGNLTFVDRLKDIIISGGLNISAAEIERVISEIDGVKEVAVLSARDADFGETPLAVIYSDDGKVSVPVVIEH